MIKLKFNLIEILISMIVIIFAMFIIMSFIPLASQQASEAQIRGQISNFSNSFLSYLQKQSTAQIKSAFPIVTDYDTDIAGVTTTRSEYDSINDSTGVSASDGWQSQDNSYLHINTTSSKKHFFKITQFSRIDDGTSNGRIVKDTEVELRTWRTEPSLRNNINNITIDTDYFNSISSYRSSNDIDVIPFVTRVHMEFSWPIKKPYSERQKVYLFYDLNML